MTDYAVLICHRNEEQNLLDTVANIRATQKHCVEYVLDADADGAGTSQMRHRGVMKSTREILIACDAHMRFAPGALDAMADFVAANPLRVSCLKCHHNSTLSFGDKPYHGADLWLKVRERDQFTALTPRWRQVDPAAVTTEPEEIGCVMGACYAFSRDLYNRIGQPWSMGRGWGCDEERLSIAARLVGGSVWLHPAECAHLYRAQSQIPYQLTPQDCVNVWYNRLSLLYYLPLPLELRIELSDWLHLNNTVTPTIKNQIRISDLIDECRQILMNNQTIEWQDYAQQWLKTLNNPETELMTKDQLKNKLARAGIAFSPAATHAELMRLLNAPAKTSDEKNNGGAEKRDYVPNPTAADYGIRCPHCGAVDNGHKVTHTYPASKRRVCCRCGLPFVTMNAFDHNPDRRSA